MKLVGMIEEMKMMKTFYSPYVCSRLTSLLLIAAVAGLALAPMTSEAKRRRPPAELRLNAWEYDRGNTRVSENPGTYGDYRDRYPELMLVAGDETQWRVEYDIELPIDSTYALRVRYASAGVWPLDVLLDGKSVGQCCFKMTANAPPSIDGGLPTRYWDRHTAEYEGMPERPWDRHGAVWEDSCSFPITKGKHTLTFTRKGPPANLLDIRLESPVKFPADWKAPKRKFDLDRIPIRYRTVFLTPDAVNIGTLQQAIKDNIKTFGPRYAKGPQYLTELADLETKQVRAAGGTTNEQQAVETALNALRQDAMLDNPELDFDKLLFVKKRYFSGESSYKGHIYHGNDGGNICLLSPVSPEGNVTPLVPELTNGVFGRFDLSFDATKVLFCFADGGTQYRIYEIDIDPKTGLRAGGNSFRQLTFGNTAETSTIQQYTGDPTCGKGFDDIDPVYLPNGKIMFCSTRSERSVLCFPASVTSLHVMDADGKNIHCISEGQVNEISPCVLDDGRVVYMRWEYVDKGFANVQSLWAVRPDGSGSDHVFKNMMICPGAMMHARSIPNSRKIIATAAGHHGGHQGPIALIDNRRHRRTADAVDNITPELGFPGMGQRGSNGAFFRDPYPFSETFFLVAHKPGGARRYRDGAEVGIYALDAWGNRAVLYRDPDMSCQQPMPLLPRRMPTDIPAATAAAPTDTSTGQALATMFMTDVYQGLPGIERGRVKYVRVTEAMNLGWYDTWRAGKQQDSGGQQASAVSLDGDVGRKFVHGIATVYEDGSAFFTVPASKNLFFQALDENFMELHRMRTFLNLLPGENRSCVGCHEVRRKAPGLRKKAQPMAMAKGPQPLYFQPGDSRPRAVHYPVDVQPILDKHCISCHSGKEPKGKLTLTGEQTVRYSRSYEELCSKDLVSYLRTASYGSSHVALEPPLTFGSHRSKMMLQLLKGHHKVKLSREESIKIVTWIDSNAPFYGTHDGKKNLKWHAEPDFRPDPKAPKSVVPLAMK